MRIATRSHHPPPLFAAVWLVLISFALIGCSSAEAGDKVTLRTWAMGREGEVDVTPKYGRVARGIGRFDADYLGIDQGPIIAMVENYRSDLIWKTMRKNPYIVAGLKKAGFTGGWLGN